MRWRRASEPRHSDRLRQDHFNPQGAVSAPARSGSSRRKSSPGRRAGLQRSRHAPVGSALCAIALTRRSQTPDQEAGRQGSTSPDRSDRTRRNGAACIGDRIEAWPAIFELASGLMSASVVPIYLQDSPKTCYIRRVPFVLVVSTGSNTFFRAESIMTNQPKDTSKPADQPDKKKSETVHLTAEDLRAISGGAMSNPGTSDRPATVKVATPPKLNAIIAATRRSVASRSMPDPRRPRVADSAIDLERRPRRRSARRGHFCFQGTPGS